jgi:hypothetical protein
MIETFRNFQELNKLYDGEETLSEIAVKYQTSPDNMVYLARTFCELFGVLTNLVGNYFYLTEEDKASYCVEETHKAMMAYDPDKGYQVQTLIRTYVDNRLRAETQMLQCQKRKANYLTTDYGDLDYNDVETELHIEQLELLDLIKSGELGLTDNEIAICEIIVREPNNLQNTEIAEELGMTSAGVAYIKKQLAQKLDGYLLA